jgi:ATP synthase protein I
MSRNGSEAGVTPKAGESYRAFQARASRTQVGERRAKGLETGWVVVSYLLSGLIAYGAIGWLVARVTHIQLLFPVGMLVGIAISVGYVIYRFGRQGMADESSLAQQSRVQAQQSSRAYMQAHTQQQHQKQQHQQKQSPHTQARTKAEAKAEAQAQGPVERNDR